MIQLLALATENMSAYIHATSGTCIRTHFVGSVCSAILAIGKSMWFPAQIQRLLTWHKFDRVGQLVQYWLCNEATIHGGYYTVVYYQSFTIHSLIQLARQSMWHMAPGLSMRLRMVVWWSGLWRDTKQWWTKRVRVMGWTEPSTHSDHLQQTWRKVGTLAATASKAIRSSLVAYLVGQGTANRCLSKCNCIELLLPVCNYTL